MGWNVAARGGHSDPGCRSERVRANLPEARCLDDARASAVTLRNPHHTTEAVGGSGERRGEGEGLSVA